MFWIVYFVVLAAAVWLVVKFAKWQVREANRGAESIVCPHCQTRGSVHVMPVKRKKGISGGKATAAVFTLGTSMLATGLSRKERVMAMSCRNCKTRWDA